MSRISRGLKSPSKFISLNHLIEIRENRYRGKDGKEYSPSEVEHLIYEKTTAKNKREYEDAINRFNHDSDDHNDCID